MFGHRPSALRARTTLQKTLKVSGGYSKKDGQPSGRGARCNRNNCVTVFLGKQKNIPSIPGEKYPLSSSSNLD
jgi:hypothetical protein